MIIVRCPVRISLIGGSSDLDAYLDLPGRGSVISFTPTIYTYVSVYKDKLGRNSMDSKYIVQYTKREEVTDPQEIGNELVREFILEQKPGPCSVHLTSDVFSYGSGLAVSSSYAASLAKALSIFGGHGLSDIECATLAHRTEKKINPLLGQQDVYGCSVGGFKMIEFTKNSLPSFKFLPTELFQHYTPYLCFTGVTRNSTSVLQTMKMPEKDVYNPLVAQAVDYLMSQNYPDLFAMIREGWEAKKATSPMILGSEELRSLDSVLYSIPACRAHKLCGAGNGGFFLAFFDKDTVPEDHRFVPLTLSPAGVQRLL